MSTATSILPGACRPGCSRTCVALYCRSSSAISRAVSFAVLGVVTALAGIVLGPLIPDALGTRIGASSADQILSILASSMLAVVT